MIDITILFIWVVWYLNTYRPPPLIFNLIIRFKNLYNDFFTFYNKILYFDYWNNENSQHDDNNIIQNNNIHDELTLVKYEDKYLEYIKKLNKEWEFTEDEKSKIPNLIENFYNGYIRSKTNIIEEITSKIIKLENEILHDNDNTNYIEDFDDEYDELITEDTLEVKRTKIRELQKEAYKIKVKIQSEEGINELKNVCINQARQYIIDMRLDKLKNCYVIEKTPIGNVLMLYDKDRESFKYYSDCNIPYRYLEVVGRKYVKSFGCRPIFVDMEEELIHFEEKCEREQGIKKRDNIKAEESLKYKQSFEVKKNVFAKFKSYNKDSSGGKLNMAIPPKNNIPNRLVNEKKENEKILLKERANRYTYEGKIANFNFLQKIERKIFNKKLDLSFADFKNMKK